MNDLIDGLHKSFVPLTDKGDVRVSMAHGYCTVMRRLVHGNGTAWETALMLEPREVEALTAIFLEAAQ